VASSLVLGGRRVAVQRPRARSVAGRELRLPSWREWSARDPLEQRAVEQMVLGVSTRGYARSLEPLPEAVAVRGVSKSAVSERFVYGTERKLAELMSRELRQLRVVALLIDGAKALHKAVVEVFGAHGLIQRRREHKKRNVTDALPERLRVAVRSAMNEAYATRDIKRARRLLGNLCTGRYATTAWH